MTNIAKNMSANLLFIDRHVLVSPSLTGTPHPLAVDLGESGEFNVSNSNAKALLSALGYEYTQSGSEDIPIRELWAACERFLKSDLATILDGGTRPKVLGNWTTCGRRDGYLTEKITTIKTLCEVAIQLNATHAYLG